MSEPVENIAPYSRRAQLESLLAQLSNEQIQQFIVDLALNDAQVRDALLIQFGDYIASHEGEEEHYRATFERMIQRHQNQRGYIVNESAQHLIKHIESLLESARRATTPATKAINLSLASLRSIALLGERVEDNEGDIYRLMRLACVVLWECFATLNSERQQILFERLLTEYTDPIYLDLDLDSFLLTLLKDLAKDNKAWQTACLHQQEKLLKAAKHDKWRRNYLLEQLNDLLTTWHKPKNTKKPA